MLYEKKYKIALLEGFYNTFYKNSYSKINTKICSSNYYIITEKKMGI